MSITDYSLLPDNKSPLERGLELAFTALLYGIENPFPNLLNPAKTAPAMLPYLAQDRGVPEWDSLAPESEKRETVSNIWPIRRYAGTKKGIRLAVESLEYDADIVPWYKSGQAPYTFSIVAWKRPSTFPHTDTVSRMLAHVEDAKSERDTYSFLIGAAFDVELKVGLSNVNRAAMVRRVARPKRVIPLESSLLFAASFQAANVTQVTMEIL